MNIVIYNINSFGGNYEYAKFLHRAYARHKEVASSTLLMPANAPVEEKNILKILCSDISLSKSRMIRRMYFLYRSIVNPVRLFLYLRKLPASMVLLNDYDQPTALLWVPLLHLLKRRHRFAVLLHDPDRDNFFPVKKISEWTMQSVMSLMDVAFYHGFLPVKSYYRGHYLKVKVPHGIYEGTDVDTDVLADIRARSKGYSLIGILGNIRPEKNYELIMDAVAEMDSVKLLVAGKAANSGVSVQQYKQYAVHKNVADKIIWIEGYLDQSAFNAGIKACDIIMLYYKPSFTSQSGVLNTIAPYGKKLIISNAQSSLKECVEQYDLATIVPQDDVDCLVKTIGSLLSSDKNGNKANWERYMLDSSWEKHVDIAVESYKKLIG